MSIIDREANMKLEHSVPIGAIVRYQLDPPHEGFMVLRVVGHSRDCDETPLYMLAENLRAGLPPEEAPLYSDAYLRYRLHAGYFVGNVGRESFSVVRLPREDGA